MTSFKWPPVGGGGVDTYPTFAAFPVSASDGALGIALDTRILYEYSTTAMNWAAIGGPGVALSVGTIDSQPKVADGLQIVGSDIIPQTVDSTYPGLMTSADYDLLQTAWVYAGNAGTTPGTDFIGTSDAQDLVVKTNGITQLTFDKDGGWYSDQTQVPVDATAKIQYNLTTNVVPGVTTTTADDVGFNSFLPYDSSNAGFNHGGRLAPFEGRLEHNGSGTINNAFIFNGSANFNANGGTTNLFKGFNSAVQVQGTSTVTSLNGFFAGFGNTAGAIITNGAMYGGNFNWTDATVGSFYAASLTGNIDGATAVSGGVEAYNSGLTVQGTATVTNQTIGHNNNVTVQGSAVVNYVQGDNINVLVQGSSTATSVTARNGGITAGGTASLGNVTGDNMNMQFNGASVANGISGGNFSLSMSNTASCTGINAMVGGSAEFNDTSVAPYANGANFYVNTNDTAEVDSVTVFNATSTLASTYTSTNFQIGNMTANITGASPTNGITGLNMSLSSSVPIVNQATGISINMSGVTLDSSVLLKTGLNISDGAINAGATVNLPGALPFYQINYIAGNNNVVSGTPTNAYGFGNNFAHLINFQDDWGPDATTLRLGFVDVGFVGAVQGAAGKTMDSWTGALGGAGNASGAGTIDQAIMFRAAGILPQGGSLTVNNAYGFYVMPTLSTVATNAWGVYVADTNSDNWFAKNAIIGGISGTPSNSDVAFEIASQKAILMPILTTVQRNALTALEGMIIYNTTTNDVEFYDGTSWQGTVGTAFITAVSDTATIDLTVSSGTLSADVIDDSIDNLKLANMATQTFKGRTTAGTGNPEDLTATQATAILDVMVGDSGAGGTKGLVPAPATGDATKYLRGDATWQTIPSSATVTADFEWREGMDAAQVSLSSDNVQIGTYQAGLTQSLYGTFKVPQNYVAGNQIFLRMPFYSGDSSGNVLFQTVATLVRTGTDTIGSTTNQRTSTNSAVTLSAGTVNEPQAVNYDLTSATGQINGVAVSAGDVIKVRLTRGTDTATGVANAILDAKELTFA